MRALQKQYVVDRKGQKTAARIHPGDYLICYLTGVSRLIGVLEVKSELILSIRAYGALLEYPPDISIITKRLYEPTITFEEIKKGLKEDGLL